MKRGQLLPATTIYEKETGLKINVWGVFLWEEFCVGSGIFKGGTPIKLSASKVRSEREAWYEARSKREAWYEVRGKLRRV